MYIYFAGFSTGGTGKSVPAIEREKSWQGVLSRRLISFFYVDVTKMVIAVVNKRGK